MLFDSGRLKFRIWHIDDLEDGLALWGNQEVMKLIEPALDRSQVIRSINKGVEHYHKYGVQHFAMVLKESNKIIGCCGLSVEDYEQSIYEFVIHILPDYQQNGYGLEAGRAVLAFAQSKAISKIIAACHVENLGSKKLLTHLNFKYIEDVWYDDTNRYESYYEIDL